MKQTTKRAIAHLMLCAVMVIAWRLTGVAMWRFAIGLIGHVGINLLSYDEGMTKRDEVTK